MKSNTPSDTKVNIIQNNTQTQATLDNIKVDLLKNGGMFIVSRILLSGDLMDKDWLLYVFFSLLGFMFYDIIINNLLDTNLLFNEPAKLSIDDTLKYGAALIMPRLLSGMTLNDPLWIKQTAFEIFGYIVYDTSTINFIDFDKLIANSKVRLVVQDWVKVGTMRIVSGLLTDRLTIEWLKESLALIVGYTFYDVFIH